MNIPTLCWYIVQLSIINSGFPIRNLVQEVHWMSDWMTVPWVGLDKAGCKYLEGNCGMSGRHELVFKYPVKIMQFYPPVINWEFITEFWMEPVVVNFIINLLLCLFQGLYPIRWQFKADNPHGGDPIYLGCILTKINIVAWDMQWSLNLHIMLLHHITLIL